MKAEVTATFVGGLLKPDDDLALPDHTRVKLTIETIGPAPDAAAAWNALKARLAQRPVHGGGQPVHVGGQPFTRDELHERH